MRYIYILIFSIVVINTNGQDKITLLNLDSITSNNRINHIIDSVFSKSLYGKKNNIKIYKRYISIAPKFEQFKEDSFFIDSWPIIRLHTNEVIDSSMQDIETNSNPTAIMFVTYPFSGYVLVEVIVTDEFRGYYGSVIFYSKRLQFLLKRINNGEFKVVDYRAYKKANNVIYLDR